MRIEYRGSTAGDLMRTRRCRTVGCENLAPMGGFCEQCLEEIAALSENACERQEKRETEELLALFRAEERRQKIEAQMNALRRTWRFAAKWIWIPNLIVIVGALAYLAFAWGAVLIERLQ